MTRTATDTTAPRTLDTRAACALSIDGIYYTMTGPTGTHRLLVADTTDDRLAAHWRVFCGDLGDDADDSQPADAAPHGPLRVRLTAAQVSRVLATINPNQDCTGYGRTYIDFADAAQVRHAAGQVGAYMHHVHASGDGYLQGDDYHPAREAFAMRQCARACNAAEAALLAAVAAR